jgi:hypothetical protein
MTEQHVPDWKRFQDLVARIHTVGEGSGAIVRSPDHVLDLQTGESREVDVSIRRRGASGIVLLITVEARDHKDVQDVTWIEQLSTKRRKIGADLTIAVSGSGFSRPALLTAEAEGILATTLEELEANDISWLAPDFFFVENPQTFVFRDFRLELWDKVDPGSERLEVDEAALARIGWFDYPLFMHKKTGARFSLAYVVERAEEAGFDPFAGATEGESKSKKLVYEWYDQGIGVATSNGVRPVKKVHILYRVRIESISQSLSTAYRYSSPRASGRLEGFEVDLALPGAKFVFQKDFGDGGAYKGFIVRA